jgi:hypothetical protein
MSKSIELISLIYKSTEYLESIYNEMKSDFCKVDGWDVQTKIVANDANESVLNRLKELDINAAIYNDRQPEDFYLNRVYRCWNLAGMTSKCDAICFVNSDMCFSPNWLANLLKHHNGINIPCSRLVESGRMPSGQHAYSRNFGRRPKEFARELWLDFANKISIDKVEGGGLYMPVVFETERFIESGGYPEGNICQGGVGAWKTPVIQSGDAWYFRKLEKKYGMRQITPFDSCTFHFQEGEKSLC